MTEEHVRVSDIVPPEDMKWLRRFAEICEDSDAGGHDLPKAVVKRLEQFGALRSCGFGQHETTAFGDWLLAEREARGRASDTHIPDEVFGGVFAQWWEDEGQHCRAGGGDYERTFAFQAWRHLYPQLLQARAVLAQHSSVVEQEFNFCCCGDERSPEVTPKTNSLGGYFWAECPNCKKSVSAFTEIGLIQTWNAVCRTPRKPVDQDGKVSPEARTKAMQLRVFLGKAGFVEQAHIAEELMDLLAAAPQSAALAKQLPEGVRAWFEAKQAHVSAVDAYNARLKFVRENCPFGTSVDPEYQLMEQADRKARDLVGPMFDELRELLDTALTQGAGIQP
ncbi:hypothetical protein [Pseudomonas aeruginosa]|uniref:hypothetical protein n=1 Tax=Pseudomonas aeruginosa TaxID=287 RepID=UPI00287F6CCD|nr:hypothetical protein [Pseudomonas aeruginosa]